MLSFLLLLVPVFVVLLLLVVILWTIATVQQPTHTHPQPTIIYIYMHTHTGFDDLKKNMFDCHDEMQGQMFSFQRETIDAIHAQTEITNEVTVSTN